MMSSVERYAWWWVTRWRIVATLALAAACQRSSPADVGSGLAWLFTDSLINQPFTAETRATSRVLAAAATDTVWLWRPGGEHDYGHLVVWTNWIGDHVVERWRSPVLTSPGVIAQLKLVDADWLFDLFITASAGEMYGGELLLGRHGGVHRAFATNNGDCALPVLYDANVDGRWDVVTYESGTGALSHCARGLPVECRQSFEVYWAVPHIQTPNGFSADSSLGRFYYGQRAKMHNQGAMAIRRALHNAPSNRVPPDACHRVDLADALDSLAFRAQRIYAPGWEPDVH